MGVFTFFIFKKVPNRANHHIDLATYFTNKTEDCYYEVPNNRKCQNKREMGCHVLIYELISGGFIKTGRGQIENL